MTRLLAAMLLASIMTLPSSADDSGLIVAAGVDKKVSKKLTVGAELEFRSRNNWRTADRLALSLDAQYKLLSWLKAGAGYELLVDNNPEKISYHTDGDLNNWRPSYWGTRHRLNATLTGTYTYKKRFSVSLRERYQFTCRPTHTTCRYDFDNAFWEDTEVNSRCKHVLRSGSNWSTTPATALSTPGPAWNSSTLSNWKKPACKWVLTIKSRKSTPSPSITVTKP